VGGSHRSGHRAKGSAQRKGGAHRPEPRHLEPHVWLGAGAITLGVGAALANGSGIAHAEGGAGGSSASSSSSSTTGSSTMSSAETDSNVSAGAPPPGAASTLTGESGDPGTTGPHSSSDGASSSGSVKNSPATSVSASGGNVTTTISSTSGKTTTESGKTQVVSETTKSDDSNVLDTEGVAATDTEPTKAASYVEQQPVATLPPPVTAPDALPVAAATTGSSPDRFSSAR
jgi:hypothetical protein